MGKKVLSVLCMVALVFTFCVGCGDSGAQGDTEQTYNFKLAMSYPTDHADTQSCGHNQRKDKRACKHYHLSVLTVGGLSAGLRRSYDGND